MSSPFPSNLSAKSGGGLEFAILAGASGRSRFHVFAEGDGSPLEFGRHLHTTFGRSVNGTASLHRQRGHLHAPSGISTRAVFVYNSRER